MATDTDLDQYLKWDKDVARHDYTAAANYLSIRFGESQSRKVSKKLQKVPVIYRRANDILRATQRAPLPLSDPGVLKDLKRSWQARGCPRYSWQRPTSRTATTGSPSPTRSTPTPPYRSN